MRQSKSSCKNVQITSIPVGKIAKKNSLKECFFVNSAHCHIAKNTLPQTVFTAILPTYRMVNKQSHP